MKLAMTDKRVYLVFWAALLLSLLLVSIICARSHGVEYISFASNQTGNFDIHIMDTNGEYLDNLTDHPADDFDPTWSPDGRFLGYVSNRDGNAEIYVMDTELKKHRRLTHAPGTDSRPTWSPDGRWIAFVSNRRGSSDIYKMDANGEKIRRLTKTGNNGSPVWSPDGQWIVFFSQLDRRVDLYVMTAEGRGLRLLLPARLRGLLLPVWHAGYTWSLDGKQIAFGTWEPQNIVPDVPPIVRAVRAEVAPILEGVNPNIQVPVTLSVFDIGAENVRKLTQVPPVGERRPSPIPQIFRPAWSPNGDWIAYSISDVGNLWGFSADLHVINVRNDDGVGTPLVRTGGGKFYLSPAWVPAEGLSVSPSAEKQTTLWGRLKQKAD